MPIPPEIRRQYYSKASGWPETRKRILTRAQWCCERCGVPDKTEVWRGPEGVWFDEQTLEFIRPGETLVDSRPPCERGKRIYRRFEPEEGHVAKIRIGVAHLNHTPGDDGDENLAAWCSWCHLDFDKPKHADTRAGRKDRARPLLTGAVPWYV